MAESKPGPTPASPHHHETHGLRTDIDEKTPLDSVKAPNMFERAKEEIEAIVEAIHPKKESPTHGKSDQITAESKKPEKADSKSEDHAKTPNFIDKAKEKIGTIMHHDNSPKSHHEETHEKKSPKIHDKETHGMSDDIDESIPIDHVKAPNVFERAKEEIEAIVQAIHPKKEEKNPVSPPKKEGGLGASIGRGLEKMCSPKGNRD